LTLDQQILQKEELINQLMQGLNDEKIRLNSWELRNENVQASLGKLETRRTALYSKIDEALNLFELSIKDKEFSKILDLLEKKKSDFEKAVNREVKEKQELALIEQELKQVLQLEKEIGKRLAQIESKYVSLNVELTDLQENRKSIFGDKEVQIVQEELKNQLVALENRVEANKAALNEADIQLKSELAKAQKNNKDLEKIVKAISKDETQLLKKIKRKGFDSILALKMANLEEAEANELEKLKTNLERQLAQNEQSLLDANQEHKKLIAKDLSKDALDTLLEKRQEREALIAETQQKLGRLTQQIEDNNRRQATGKSLLKKMDVQKKEHKRWAKLKEIIGSADGKVFRAFAQGLTLKRLSELANRHLMQLNGRYLIHKPNDQDLALEIIDTHQANNIRSIHTLSGGESFLVSLALALGLSDLAGRNTQINSLFIDEGFGTLDESALDLAISTLENLQSKGKTIGIISHVYALKERIGTQIQVHRKGSGFSDIVLVG
jgi:exonuclease SbcC